MLQGIVNRNTATVSGAGGGNITYIGSTEVSAGASPVGTFINHAIGAAAADRLVVVLVTGYRTTLPARTLVSVTIDGVLATTHATVVNNGANCRPNLSISSLVIAAGTTATIVATYDNNLTQVTVSVYTITGLSSITPVATGSNAVAAGDPSTTANVTGPGVAVGLWVGSSGVQSGVTFTGLATEDSDNNVGVVTARAASAHDSNLSTEAPRTFSGTSTMTDETIIVATWN